MSVFSSRSPAPRLEHAMRCDANSIPVVRQVRHVAVANETPYGVTKFVEHAIWDDLPKIVCVQSPYNLLTQNRVEMGERAESVFGGLHVDLLLCSPPVLMGIYHISVFSARVVVGSCFET